jgi:O-antigen/teichoic acid export membrane protein
MQMEEKEKDDSYTHILKYTGLFGGVQGLNILIGIVRNKLVALILGPDGMGLVALFNSTIKLISDSTNFGIAVSAVRNVSEAQAQHDGRKLAEAIRLIRSWSLLTALLGLLACLLMGPLLSRWTFSWGDHTLHFVMLSPVIALMAITGGETAILKGLRRLRPLAAISVYNVLFALASSVPLYYFFGQAGIVPSLVIMALGQCAITVAYSYRLHRPVFTFSRSGLQEGKAMFRLGIAFVLTGILGSGAEFAIRTYLNNTGQLAAVGLYNAGFMMIMTLAGIVFSSMESDYFPRLSGFDGVGADFNRTVNRQAEVSLLLIAPLLILFMVTLPVLLPLLYSGKFLPILDMIRIGTIAMYFRALTLPMEYISLARGDSHSYLFLEAVYDITLVLLVILGYEHSGLTGTGIGLALAGLVNLAVVSVYTHHRYRYVMAPSLLFYTLIQIPLGLLGCLFTFMLQGFSYWVAGSVLTLLSLSVSLRILHSKAHLWHALRERVVRRLKLTERRRL